MRKTNQDSSPKPEKGGSKGKQEKKGNSKGKQEKEGDSKGIAHVRKDRQEAQHTESNIKSRKEQLQNELQGYMYSQSSKLSSVSRNLTFGILGTIWVMTFSEGKMKIPNPYLFYALLTSLLFMVVDVVHYLWDSISYHHQQYKLDNYTTVVEIDRIHEKKMDKINKRSHYFLIGKTIVLFVAAIFFIRGIIEMIPSICELIRR